MIAVIRKELRDLLPWMFVAAILFIALCWFQAPRTLQGVGIESELLGFASVVIALAFGLLQSLPDSRTEAKGYLLHRPISLTKIFWAKMLAGGIAYVVSLLPGMLGLAVYLERMGPERLPTSATHMLPSFVLALVLFVVHPSAMGIAFRDARWLGSKTLPLIFALLAGIAAAECIIHLPGYRAISVCLAVVVWSVAIATALHAFCYGQFQLSASAEKRSSLPVTISVLVACLVITTWLGTMGFYFCQSGTFSPQYDFSAPSHRLAFVDDAEMWEVTETRTSQSQYSANSPPLLGSETNVKRQARRHSGDNNVAKDWAPIPKQWNERVQAVLSSSWQESNRWASPFQYFDSLLDGSFLFERDGRVYLYSDANGLIAVVTPKGFFGPDDVAEGKFDGPFRLWQQTSNPQNSVSFNSSNLTTIADAAGIYQLDFVAGKVHVVVEQTIDQVSIVAPRETQKAVFWLLNNDKLTRHEIQAASPEQPLTAVDSVVNGSDKWQGGYIPPYYTLPLISAKQTDEWTVTPPLQESAHEYLSVSETSNGVTAIVRHVPLQLESTYQILEPDQTIRSESTWEIPASNPPNDPVVYPPAVYPIARMGFGESASGMFNRFAKIGLAVHSIVAIVLSFWIASTRELTLRARGVWALIAAALGVSAPLAMLAIYPCQIREPCTRCETPRRIDLSRCKKCGADWERPELTGTEILGPRNLSRSLSELTA